MLKTPGGLIHATAIIEEGRLRDLHLSGDFFFYPSKDLAELERALEGVPAEPESTTEAIEQFYAQRSIE
jgi:lipoate-protein ligase A